MLAGNDYIAMPTDAHAPGIVSLYDANDQHRLTLIDYEYAEDLYSGLRPSVRNPVHFSVWTNVIYLWPSTTYTADRTYRMRGYRKTTDWIASGASSSPDCDVRLHLPLAHYATALAYLQQEDEQLEQVYMNRWQRDVEMARQVIMDPSQHRPLVMGPRIYTRIGNLNRYQPSFIIDAP